MKTRKLLALILALTTLLTVFITPVGATEEQNHQDIEIVIMNEDISEEAKEKIYAYYSAPDHNHENAEDGSATTYGLICTVIGHKIDTSTVYTINHKARATAPRCLRKTYLHEVCTRCDDYETSTLTSTKYINCCA